MQPGSLHGAHPVGQVKIHFVAAALWAKKRLGTGRDAFYLGWTAVQTRTVAGDGWGLQRKKTPRLMYAAYYNNHNPNKFKNKDPGDGPLYYHKQKDKKHCVKSHNNAALKLSQGGHIMYNMHALFFKFRHCFSRIEGLTDTPREWQQKSGDETGVFGVDGGELTAVVGGKAAHVHVRDFFQLEPETTRREGGRV